MKYDSMKKLSYLFVAVIINLISFGQIPFKYDVQIVSKTVTGFPGVHSFVHGQANGKWVIIGGRRDGLHARQPFNAFPEAYNNMDIFVIDPVTEQLWTASLNGLPTSIKEQLQTTNMNFHQEGDTLYLLGGYGYSATATDHITFPNLTSVVVSDLIDAVVQGTSIDALFKQITEQNFAVAGGHLATLGDTFYLVCGNRFDGRYNPMGNATYVQTYVNGIRKFTIDNSGAQLSFANYSEITDQVHLHRRDYNLVPQIYPNGEDGLMISSGVFQIGLNAPFLYPVDITANGYTPQTGFNQYLSNYHSPIVGVYDGASNAMHSLFFGGMSQYYYSNGTLVQDNAVPFVKTISRVSRDVNGNLLEVVFPNEMPGLIGASAEFINNESLPMSPTGVILLDQISADSVMIGHVVGGIATTSLNPFTANNSVSTSASNGIYEVWLKRNDLATIQVIDGNNPFKVAIHPNPTEGDLTLEITTPYAALTNLFVNNIDGKIVYEMELSADNGSLFKLNCQEAHLSKGTYLFNFVYDGKFSRIEKVILTK
jgi:hypothetical protein